MIASLEVPGLVGSAITPAAAWLARREPPLDPDGEEARRELRRELAGTGAMVSVAAQRVDVEEWLERWAGRLSVASPTVTWDPENDAGDIQEVELKVFDPITSAQLRLTITPVSASGPLAEGDVTATSESSLRMSSNSPKEYSWLNSLASFT